MRIAALDLGTNSFHLLVADVRPDGTFETVAREKEVLRLGDVVAGEGRITTGAADRAVASVRRFRRLAEASGATELIAKATSAIRSAPNGSEVVDRIESETGVDVEVISSHEEARLIFGAIRASVSIDPGPALCFDLGGGSVEIMIGDRSGLLWDTSLNLGVGRLTAKHLHTDPPVSKELERIESEVRRALEPVSREVSRYAPTMTIGSSGTLSDIVAVATAARSRSSAPRQRNQTLATRSEIEALHSRLVAMTGPERRRLPGLEETRSELVVAGSVFVTVVMDVFDVEALTISGWALREGIVLDTVGSHEPDDWSDDPRALRRAAVAGLARRCTSDARHASHVAVLAQDLFDATGEIHGLGPDDREMLEYAALLHDIGQHVSRKGHHRHAAYLVEHGGLRGFAPDEVHFLAALVRHHRRGEPKPSEPLYGALGREGRSRVRSLAAILRIADGLDRGRRQVVEHVSAQVGEDLLVLRLQVHGDAELELWGARRKRDLMELVFGREVELEVAQSSEETAPSSGRS